MKITESYYEEPDSPAQIKVFNKSVPEFMNYLSNIYSKELETCHAGANNWNFILSVKNSDSGESYGFDLEGSQEEMENFALSAYLTQDVNWKPVFVLIPFKGLAVSRISDNEKFFITNVDSYSSKITLCSSVGDIVEVGEVELRNLFRL